MLLSFDVIVVAPFLLFLLLVSFLLRGAFSGRCNV